MIRFIKKYSDMWSYLVFGVLTTAVNYLVYFPCFYYLGWSAGLSNITAWVVAVAFAFFTNKPLVFKSHDWSPKVLFPELWKFVTCRIVSGMLETVILVITVDWLTWNGTWMKLITAVLVVILNYIASKLLVFRK